MTKRVFPKILVATSFPPDVPGGSPWLLYQLLRGVAAERVSWWSSSGTAPTHSSERVGTFRTGSLPPRLVPHKRFTELKSSILERFWVPRATRDLREYVDREEPELLWILAYSWSIPVLHRVLPVLKIPWHITVHDMADSAGSIRSLGIERASNNQKMVDELYAGAVSRDVYTREIASEMERNTGAKADLILHCGAEPEEIACLRTKDMRSPGGTIRIGYPGTIIAESTFCRFIASLQLLRSQFHFEVHLFGVHSYRDRQWYDESLIIEHGYLPDDELDRRYRACDWGLAIMELDDTNPRYNRFSLPCKFARALAIGLPVIAIGHPDCTLIRFAGEYKLGPVISTLEVKSIASALMLAFSEEQNSALRGEIIRCVESEFNAESNRKRLHALFLKSARSPHHV